MRRRRDVGDLVGQIVRARIARKLHNAPAKLRRLVDAGVIPPDFLASVPPDADPDVLVAELRIRIAAEVRHRPSLLRHLGLEPLELLRPAPERELPPADSIETIVFSDLAGFTRFCAERGDQEASALLTHHYETVEVLVRSRGGRVVKTLGDGHMLSFAEPAAAVLAGLELVAAAPAGLELRAGANHGPVVRAADDVLGHVVNVAARVADLAPGGHSLVTRAVRDAAGPLERIAFRFERAERVPGVKDPVEVCEAVFAA